MESQEDSPAATGDERADGDLEPSPDLRDARAQVFTQARECTPEPVKADAKRNRSPSDADPSGQPAPKRQCVKEQAAQPALQEHAGPPAAEPTELPAQKVRACVSLPRV